MIHSRAKLHWSLMQRVDLDDKVDSFLAAVSPGVVSVSGSWSSWLWNDMKSWRAALSSASWALGALELSAVAVCTFECRLVEMKSHRAFSAFSVLPVEVRLKREEHIF